ncbi:MAG TPA: hypothetical protein VG474_05785 [Solirubrobacteraceae bacterium]|nr:hypothetical protein [Solirubrobacteraceae bacterium]
MGERGDERPASPHQAEDLLRRALIDSDDAAAVALRVGGLALSEALTIVFHGRRDLGTLATYVANGGRGAGAAIGFDELLRVPCDLDLGDARDRAEAEALYAQQAAVLRDALVAADTVLSLWCEALAAAPHARVAVDRSPRAPAQLPVPRLMPVALVDRDTGLTVAPVCNARPLAEGRPPMGIACAQQDVAHVYPLPDDPQACLEDFVARAGEHARALAERLRHQEASVRRFLELNDDGFDEAG